MTPKPAAGVIDPALRTGAGGLELGFAYTVADRVLFLQNGRILEQSDPKSVLLDPEEEGTRNFLRGHSSFRLPCPQENRRQVHESRIPPDDA